MQAISAAWTLGTTPLIIKPTIEQQAGDGLGGLA